MTLYMKYVCVCVFSKICSNTIYEEIIGKGGGKCIFVSGSTWPTYVRVYVCVRERETGSEREKTNREEGHMSRYARCVYVCVCVCVCACVCLCACVRV